MIMGILGHHEKDLGKRHRHGLSSAKGLARLFMGLGIMAGLSGCGGLVNLGPSGPPLAIYGLDPLPLLSDERGGVPLIYIEEPQLSGALDTVRIAISRDNRRFEYLADARWEERTPQLLQRYLARSIDNGPALDAVGNFNIDLPVDYRLRMDLRRFDAHRTSDGLTIEITLLASLVDALSSDLLGSRHFKASHPAASNQPDDIVAAYNAALDEMTKDLSSWIAGAVETARGAPA
ncbi:hypothetical protein JCM17846_12900 [Iodidimonas nitroreducens]|uniref:ABC-type transport auxiliary lipoprotein component domain-containing protein n=1 Tax=Iodidimonas nitroreducens TaxID=1236968 RepID=A0A5A7N691_9PROT|nr:ABC-type transport auxiliary lipoprotein family protein [Iodidimonas nitroreducens]GAK33677.1 ABC-type uncharacterized transport system, auxiliary component [alpha proteobacterium Q-1]GER03608.1 hypothetical protein JCM17846_12900 [Iodidimonas nitroreducens]